MSGRTLLFLQTSATIGAVLFSASCLRPVDSDTSSTNQCSSPAAFQRLAEDAKVQAAEPYRSSEVVACPLLDRPPDGNAAAPGLVFDEYAQLIDGSQGNFLDDGSFWLKALPRGEAHVQPLDIVSEGCQPVRFEQFSYDYAALTPPVWAVPDCGRYLSGVQAGHRLGTIAPQVMQMEATSYIRLAPLESSPILGSSYRMLSEDATYESEAFPALTHVQFVSDDARTLTFVASVTSRSFEAALQAELVPGQHSELRLSIRLFPRQGAALPLRLGLATLSSMFWKGPSDTPEQNGDEAHDADELRVGFADGSILDIALTNPDPRFSGKNWQHQYADGAKQPISLSLRQSQRDPARYAIYGAANYAVRPTLSVREIHANVPLGFELSTSNANSEYFDNVVLNLFASEWPKHGTSIDVSYVVVAEQ